MALGSRSTFNRFIASARSILKKEGDFRFLMSEEPPTINALVRALRQGYPFIDAYGEETSGSDAGRRFILELEARGVRN